MKLTLEGLRTSLSQGLRPAYLISGDEPLLVSEAADAVRERARGAGFDERDVYFIERAADWPDVLAGANNLSLFGSRKLLELRLPSAKPGVAGAKAIVQLLDRQASDTIVLMLTGRLDRERQNARWVQAFAPLGAWSPIWPLEGPPPPGRRPQRAPAAGLAPAPGGVALAAAGP